LTRFENKDIVDFILRFKLVCLKFEFKDQPSHEEFTEWSQISRSFPCITNPYNETISSFNESPYVSINMTESSPTEDTHVNHDEIASTMYARFLQLVNTSYSVNEDPKEVLKQVVVNE